MSQRTAKPLSASRFPLSVEMLVLAHLFLIVLGVFLRQFPFEIFGHPSHWGIVALPLIFVLTDLNVRIMGPASAREAVIRVLFPAFLLTYLTSVLFDSGLNFNASNLLSFNSGEFRIAIVSVVAYLVSQLVDIAVFVRVRNQAIWWLAPTASTAVASVVYTTVFYSLAYQASSDSFMASHWMELAAVGCVIKLLISLVFALPLYRLMLTALTRPFPAKGFESSANTQR